MLSRFVLKIVGSKRGVTEVYPDSLAVERRTELGHGVGIGVEDEQEPEW
jgi:hypothetical protein